MLARLLQGDSEQQVARHLGLSPHTVHDYVKKLYEKFGVRSRSALLALYVTLPAEGLEAAEEALDGRAILRVGTLVADELQVGRLRQIASNTLTPSRSAAIGGVGASIVLLGLMIFGGVGRAGDTMAEPAQLEVAEAPALQLAPEVHELLPAGQWIGISRVIAGRTYELKSTAPVELLVGLYRFEFDKKFLLESKNHVVIRARTTNGEDGRISFRDLGPTARLGNM